MEKNNAIFSEQLVQSYNLVANQEELIELTTGLIYATNKYNFAKDVARRLNHRQGRVRSSYSDDERRLMTFLQAEDEENEQEKMEKENLVEKLNIYLSDKQGKNLPELEKPRSKIISEVKAFAIHLFRNKQYELLDLLDLPSYLEPYIEPAYNLIEGDIEESKEGVFNNWIDYLEKSGNGFLVSIVILNKENFWGSNRTDNGDVFEKHFGVFEREINDYKNVYKMFCHYRRDYINLHKRVEIQRLLQVFDITVDAYDKGKQNFIHEFSKLLTDDDTKLIEGIFYEK